VVIGDKFFHWVFPALAEDTGSLLSLNGFLRVRHLRYWWE